MEMPSEPTVVIVFCGTILAVAGFFIVNSISNELNSESIFDSFEFEKVGASVLGSKEAGPTPTPMPEKKPSFNDILPEDKKQKVVIEVNNGDVQIEAEGGFVTQEVRETEDGVEVQVEQQSQSSSSQTTVKTNISQSSN